MFPEAYQLETYQLQQTLFSAECSFQRVIFRFPLSSRLYTIEQLEAITRF